MAWAPRLAAEGFELVWVLQASVGDMLLSFSIFAIFLGAFPQPVVNIEVTGNLHVPAETIIGYVDSLNGKAPSEAEFREAFRGLWDTGFFEDVRFTTKDVSGGLRLIVEVEEKPLLRTVSIRGKTRTDADLVEELRKRGVDLRPGRLFSKTDAEKAATVLANLLGDSYRVSAELEPIEGH